MQTERTIICGGVKPPSKPEDSSALALNSWEIVGPTNVWLEIEDLHEKLWRDMSPKFQDLLEIAAYVYSADAATPRGERAVTNDVDTFGSHWRRRLNFHIPVREPDFWNSKEALAVLRETLDFLSDDYYSFTFYGAHGAPPVQRFFKLETGTGPSSRPERVVLFSGGLDSLAGAVEYACGEQRKVLLVNHRSTDKFCRRHDALTKALIEKAKPVPMSQVRVLINKSKHLGAEYTQRARSFLYASMGAAVARMMELDEMTFFENGVVSLNLPVCAQVAGGRATRTTHPKVIRGMERLVRLVAERDGFRLVTPFLGDTKADVIQRIKNRNCGELIGMSRSCAETMHRSNEQPHCGVCSQCIDRRVAVIAADAERFDPLPGYAIDVFTQSLPKNVDKIMAASYIERANEVGKFKTTGQFIGAFPEVLRALRYMDGEPTGVAGRVLKLYQRHATEVTTALDLMTVRHAKAIRERKLPADCLLRIMLDARSVEVLPAVAGEPAASAVPINGAAVLPSPRYLLRRGAGVWRLVFDGKEGEIDHGRGIALVAYLLFNPPVGGVHGTELAKLAFGQEILQEASLGADGDSTRRMIQKQAKEWMAVMKNPGASDMEKAEAMEHLEQLAETLNVTRADSEGGADKQVRAVRRAIERLIDKLREANDRKNDPHPALRAFGEHLDEHLWKPSSRFGGNRRSRARAGVAGQFTYECPKGVVWAE